MAIQITKVGDVKELGNLSVMVYGQPGVGKSVFAATGKGKTLVLDFENGTQFLKKHGLNDVDVVHITDWKQVEEAVNLIKASPGKWDNIVLDPIGEVLELFIEHLKENGYSDSKGNSLSLQGYSVLKPHTMSLLKELKSLGNLIVVAHVADKQLDTDTTMQVPRLVAKLEEKVCAMCQVVAYLKSDIDKDGNKKRKLMTQPAMSYYAKDRTGALPPEGIEDPTLDKLVGLVEKDWLAMSRVNMDQKEEEFLKT